MAETETVCNICQRKLSNSFRLTIHKGRMHNNKKQKDRKARFFCLSCGNSYSNNKKLLRHGQTKHGETETIENAKVSGPAVDRGMMHKSKKQKDQKARFFCFPCAKSYSYHSHLLRHERTKHGKSVIMKKAKASGRTSKHRCPFCRSSFAIIRNLQLHIEEFHFTLKPFVCKVCGGSFLDKDMLAQHQKQHSLEDGSTGTGYHNPYITPRNQVPHAGEDHLPSSSGGVGACSYPTRSLFPAKQNMLGSHIRTERFDSTEANPSLPAAAASKDSVPYPNTRSSATRSKSYNLSSFCGICNDVRRKALPAAASKDNAVYLSPMRSAARSKSCNRPSFCGICKDVRKKSLPAAASKDSAVYPNTRSSARISKSCHPSSFCGIRNDAQRKCVKNMNREGHLAENVDICEHGCLMLNNTKTCHIAVSRSSATDECNPEMTASNYLTNEVCQTQTPDIDISASSRNVSSRDSSIKDKQGQQAASVESDIPVIEHSEDIQAVRDSEDMEIYPPCACNSTVKGRRQEDSARTLVAGSCSVISPIARPKSESFSFDDVDQDRNEDAVIPENRVDEKAKYKLRNSLQFRCTFCGRIFYFYEGIRVHLQKHNVYLMSTRICGSMDA